MRVTFSHVPLALTDDVVLGLRERSRARDAAPGSQEGVPRVLSKTARGFPLDWEKL